MSAAIAPDDIVATHADVAPDAREPLLVLEPLAAFLDEHGIGSGEIRAQPIGDGHSNVTYLIERESAEVVLRRPPRGPLPPSAHDVLREARLLRALEGTPARAPKVLAVGDDETVIGCPFYVMERVPGEVIVWQTPPTLDTPEQRRRIGEELIDALVEIHAVDWRAAGLEGFGKPTGYLERQLRRFSGLWEHNRTRELPEMERVARWLGEHLPDPDPPTPATIVHGDYRVGNAIFAAQPPAQLVAVLDWEMATIGDPLADIGYMCMFWTEAEDPAEGLRAALGNVTRAEGYPTRAELIARYEQASKRSMTDLRWYVTLALWKSAVFMEGNYKRAIAGSTDDPYLKAFGEGVAQLARQAEGVARGE
ncbi:MAG TPA: phosphotransferase family protein [Solirubrobacteraceae bacterium]|jgi:aminoglycoside phosphotransferase (APT) family kinase protein|nr:phosphotransferase family protein [Solirubrobacteraceae bacterium]